MAFTHLVDRLSDAEIEAPGPGHVELQRVTIGRDTRMALFQHPVSAVRWAAVPAGVLHTAVGIKGSRRTSDIQFEIAANGEVLWKQAVRPGRSWTEVRLEVPAGRLEFRTRAKDLSYAWSAWADPRIEHEAPAPALRRGPRNRHVFLITADAIGSDRLHEAKTPHLDRLAADGLSFAEARAQSPATIGSYASLLTGRYPTVHGVDSEWGRIPPSLPTMPVHLAGHGYHTTMIASESELSDPRQGFRDLFRQSVPCVANPAQDGALTTRNVLRWLDARPAGPCFTWIQYFDAHPPNTPPEPYRSMYYQGDPGRGDGVAVSKIRALESVQHLMYFDGQPDFALGVRLRHAGECLLGMRLEGPDLASHLRGLRLESEAPALLRMGGALMSGQVPGELQPWIRRILPRLREVEDDILTWLEGVKDGRFPLAQHLGCISYVDAQIGLLIEALKERDLYDESVILFWSPHGEVYGDRDIYFHHHVLMESSLRVPLILKAGDARGQVEGVIDSIDLFPTICEILGIASPPALDGASRWNRKRIESHPSLAVGNHRAMVSCYQDGFKLLHTLEPHSVSPGWRWAKGQRQLVDSQDRPVDRPDIAARLGELLCRV